VSGIWHLASGVWRLASGIWHLAWVDVYRFAGHCRATRDDVGIVTYKMIVKQHRVILSASEG
jgi:hypothetical protein